MPPVANKTPATGLTYPSQRPERLAPWSVPRNKRGGTLTRRGGLPPRNHRPALTSRNDLGPPATYTPKVRYRPPPAQPQSKAIPATLVPVHATNGRNVCQSIRPRPGGVHPPRTKLVRSTARRAGSLRPQPSWWASRHTSRRTTAQPLTTTMAINTGTGLTSCALTPVLDNYLGAMVRTPLACAPRCSVSRTARTTNPKL